MIDNPNGNQSQIVASWSVLRTEDTTAYTPGKGATRVRRVWYRLFDGSESYEDFPAASFDPAKVEGVIDAAAQKLAKVLNLRGPEITLGGS